ncbi:MAG: carboxylating nicotinate-nucleotide diphosphorylase [Candidatus Omnitrophica bacterium]|nr:carboxylating nicotinate-nucleotide diphosphorylase [Candidatus Omnitrophota bacterium]
MIAKRQTITNKEITRLVRAALKEDSCNNDITTRGLIPNDKISSGTIIAREDAVICGITLVKEVFKALDPKAQFKAARNDGNMVKKNDTVITIKCKTRALLSGERTALNFLAYFSGIATMTHQYVKTIRPYKAAIMDTRKTLPGLRVLAKMAVRLGGGVNHRFCLNEMVLIKDNHRLANKKNLSMPDAIRLMKKKTKKPIIVEVDTLDQFEEDIEAHPDVILLDNMTTQQIQKAVVLNKKHKKPCLLEASGGITLQNVKAVAKTGVDRISIGALTHSSKDIDFSMEF